MFVIWLVGRNDAVIGIWLVVSLSYCTMVTHACVYSYGLDGIVYLASGLHGSALQDV